MVSELRASGMSLNLVRRAVLPSRVVQDEQKRVAERKRKLETERETFLASIVVYNPPSWHYFGVPRELIPKRTRLHFPWDPLEQCATCGSEYCSHVDGIDYSMCGNTWREAKEIEEAFGRMSIVQPGILL